MQLYLLKIVCLGEPRYEVRHESDGFIAVINAMDRYPQACVISAMRIGGGA
jgi:hypothetical protein